MTLGDFSSNQSINPWLENSQFDMRLPTISDFEFALDAADLRLQEILWNQEGDGCCAKGL